VPAIRFVKQVQPSHLFDFPFESELGQTSCNQPTGDREDLIVSEDRLRSTDRAEIVDQAHPYEGVETTGADFGNQFSTAQLELTFQGGLIPRRRNSSVAAASSCRWWTLRINMKGPPAGTAVDDSDSRVLSPLSPAVGVQLLPQQIPAKCMATVWADRAAGPAIIGLDWHAPIVPGRCRFCIGARR
jgi:hypothetical protein